MIKLEQHTLNTTPVWQHVARHQMVLSYFIDTVMHAHVLHKPVEKKLFIDAVLAEVSNKQTAQDIVKKWMSSPVIEMGMLPTKDDTTHSTLMATLLQKRCYSEYHIGLYYGQSKKNLENAADLINAGVKQVNWGVGSSHVRFVALNAESVGRLFLISCLRSTDTVWHRVMQSIQLQNKLAKTLGVESLFQTPNGQSVAPRSAQETVDALEMGKIVVSPMLLRVALYAAQVQVIGHLQQSNDSMIIKERLARFLTSLNVEHGIMSDKDKTVRPDMCFDGFADLQKAGQSLTLGQIVALPYQERIATLKKLPYIDGTVAVKNAVRTQILKEVQTDEPMLVRSGKRIADPFGRVTSWQRAVG